MKRPPNNWIRSDSEDNRSLAFNFSLKYLSFRNRSFKEVFDYLIKKHFVEETINATLKKLSDLKFINDEEFARGWIESRQKYKGKSKLVLRMELKQKGVNNSLIEETLSSAQDDLETAQILFNKKMKVFGKLPPEEFKKKMGGFLQRRGFNYNIISKLLRAS